MAAKEKSHKAPSKIKKEKFYSDDESDDKENSEDSDSDEETSLEGNSFIV